MPKTAIERLVLVFLFAALPRPVIAAEPVGRPRGMAKPNIVLILADDMGYGDPGCYNSASKIPTPSMDRLATEGMRFIDAHSPSAVCSPTRYGLLTGRYSWRTRLQHGVLNGYSPSLIDSQRMTLASLLKQQGYTTACIGKWHLGLGNAPETDYDQPLVPGPNALGFDEFFGIPASLDMPPYVYIENAGPVVAASGVIEAGKSRRDGGGGFWRTGPIAPGFRHVEVLPTITSQAVEFIERQAKHASDQPFFLYFPLTAPHKPWMPTDEFMGQSRAGHYGDFTVQVDWTVSRIMGALDRLKLKDNTLLIVTSDNGARWTADDERKYDHLANHFLRGQKADIWEGGHRVPFMARWPGKITPGTTSDQVICQTDVLATFAAIVGAALPRDAGEDSYNMLPALLGEDSGGPIREAVVHHSGDGMFAIRRGPWKLILGRGSGGNSQADHVKPKPGDPAGQLYHLIEDPGEVTDLYAQRPEIVSELSALLDRYRETGRSRP